MLMLLFLSLLLSSSPAMDRDFGGLRPRAVDMVDEWRFVLLPRHDRKRAGRSQGQRRRRDGLRSRLVSCRFPSRFLSCFLSW